MRNKGIDTFFVGGLFFCFLGSIFFSAKAVIVKMAFRDTEIDAVSLLALRMIFALPFFLVSALVSSRSTSNVRFTWQQWMGVAFIGCLGYYVSSLLDFLGLQYVTASIERLILFIYPTFVLLISSLVFGYQISCVKWFAIVIAYFGLIVAYYGEIDLGSLDSNFLLGSGLIFFCAITYAIYIVGSGQLMAKIGSAKFNSYAMSFACLGVLIHYFVMQQGSLTNFEPLVYAYAVLMALVATVIPSYLVAAGIQRIGADRAAIIGSIGPLSTIVQAFYFLHEPITGFQLLGTCFVLAGVILVGKSKERDV